jgi:tripartite ATP-independent transporter DctM subunit
VTAIGLFFFFFLFVASRIPISLSLGISTAISFILGGYTDSFYVITLQIVEGVDSAPLLAIPFFILAGLMMNDSGLTDKIFDFAMALLGHVRGGLAQVVVLASMIFAGVSGTAVADCAGLGVIQVKAMTERGYTRDFSAAITLAASVVGPIIPPSVPFVIYSYLAGTSVARMFLGGILPGVAIGIILMIFNYGLSFRYNFPRERRVPLKEILRRALHGLFALVAPIIVIGSILTGVVTATEAGVLASTYTLILGLIYRQLTWRKLWNVFYETMIVSSLIMFIIGFSTAMGWLLAIEDIPTLVAKGLLSITNDRNMFLFLLIIFMLLIGCVVEGIPAMLITLPLLLPLADHFNIDRVHFGLIVVYGILIGIATPPMGIGLYIMVGVAGISFERVLKAVAPYLVPLVIALFLITYWPNLTLWIPNLILGAE